MKYAIDVSNYSSELPVDRGALASLVYSERIERVIIACQFSSVYRAWIDAVHDIRPKLEIHAYLETYDADTWNNALIGAYETLQYAKPAMLWLAMEQLTPAPSESQIEQVLSQARSYDMADDVGIYTAPYVFEAWGNPFVGNLCRLYNADYNWNGSFDVYYGGWLRASMVQYRPNHESYGLTVDLDAFE